MCLLPSNQPPPHLLHLWHLYLSIYLYPLTSEFGIDPLTSEFGIAKCDRLIAVTQKMSSLAINTVSDLQVQLSCHPMHPESMFTLSGETACIVGTTNNMESWQAATFLGPGAS